jgi:hypothetical protein
MPRKLNPTAQAILIDPPDLPYASWPPTDRWKKMNVSRGGWDWGSAAVSHGIFDPLDLIHFNFGMTDFEKVNWYLWHYVGCVNSDDGKNFTFAGADPGIIYIPQFGYTRKTPGITTVERAALKHLRDALPWYPDFWHRKVHFRPQDLKVLIQKIEDNKVDIIWDSKLKSRGEWRFKESAIYLESASNLYDPEEKATLLHEATHALLDILTAKYPKVRNYWNVHDEMSAFFAAAYWYGNDQGIDAIKYDIYEEWASGIWAAALYLAYLAIMQGSSSPVLESFDRRFDNTIEAATEIYGQRQPEKEIKAFGTFFNPYRTLMYAIARRSGYKDSWNKRRRAKGMPGKK